MNKWGKIRKMGKKRFVLEYGFIVSIPLVMDYYIVKFFLFSFQIDVHFMELIIVWAISILVGVIFFTLGWNTLEKDWIKNYIE
ncbi:hypothetical protein SM124_06450 [Bacillus sp. 31A1R]|uniref:Uncharacterized protein n=1 Tax=Robertmurraya mangrovi TaxID=3098077 RepID=A0ABU5IW55_9BACI|nr:hypothetical protein [Bacillus sp. 31A1R]MDZ5471384.1 hypothetical protein [Bacillus sp. 31A1R]